MNPIEIKEMDKALFAALRQKMESQIAAIKEKKASGKELPPEQQIIYDMCLSQLHSIPPINDPITTSHFQKPGFLDMLIYVWLEKRSYYDFLSAGIELIDIANKKEYEALISTDLKTILKSNLVEYKTYSQEVQAAAEPDNSWDKLATNTKYVQLVGLNLLQIMTSQKDENTKAMLYAKAIKDDPTGAMSIFDRINRKNDPDEPDFHKILEQLRTDDPNFNILEALKEDPNLAKFTEGRPMDHIELLAGALDFLSHTDNLRLSLADQAGLILWYSNLRQSLGLGEIKNDDASDLNLLLSRLNPAIRTNGVTYPEESSHSRSKIIIEDEKLNNLIKQIQKKEAVDAEVSSAQRGSSGLDQIRSKVDNTDVMDMQPALTAAVELCDEAAQKCGAAFRESRNMPGYFEKGPRVSKRTYNAKPAIFPYKLEAKFSPKYVKDLCGTRSKEPVEMAKISTYGKPPYEEAVAFAEIFQDYSYGYVKNILAELIRGGLVSLNTSPSLKFDRENKKPDDNTRIILENRKFALEKCIEIIDGIQPAKPKENEPQIMAKILNRQNYSEYFAFISKLLEGDAGAYALLDQDSYGYGLAFKSLLKSGNYDKQLVIDSIEELPEQILSHLALSKHIEISEKPEGYEVWGAVSPALARELQKREMNSPEGATNIGAQGPSKEPLKIKFIDDDDDVLQLISGPTGSGKSYTLAEIANILLATAENPRIPACEKVVLPPGGVECFYMPTPKTSNEASLWGTQAETIAKFTRSAIESPAKNVLILLDEMGRGTDTEQAQSIILAWLTQLNKLLKAQGKTLAVVFVTHDTDVIYAMNELAGTLQPDAVMNPNPQQLTPSHELVHGISASFGLHTLRSEGVAPEFIETMRVWLEDFLDYGYLPTPPEPGKKWEIVGGEKHEGVCTTQSATELGFDSENAQKGVFGYIESTWNKFLGLKDANEIPESQKLMMKKYFDQFQRKIANKSHDNAADKEKIFTISQQVKGKEELMQKGALSLAEALHYLEKINGPMKVGELREIADKLSKIAADQNFSQLLDLITDEQTRSAFLHTMLNLGEVIKASAPEILASARKNHIAQKLSHLSSQAISDQVLTDLGLPKEKNRDPHAPNAVAEYFIDPKKTDDQKKALFSNIKKYQLGYISNDDFNKLERIACPAQGTDLTVLLKDEIINPFNIAKISAMQVGIANAATLLSDNSFALMSAGVICQANSEEDSPVRFAQKDTTIETKGNPVVVKDGVNLATYKAMIDDKKKSATVMQYIPQTLEVPEGLSTDKRSLAVEGPNEGGKTTLAQMVGQTMIMDHVWGMAAGQYNISEDVKKLYVRLNPSLERDKEWASSFMQFARMLRTMSEELKANPGTFVILDEPWAGAGQEIEKVGVALLPYFLDQVGASGSIFTTHAHSAIELAAQTGVVTPTRVSVDEFKVQGCNLASPPSRPELSVRNRMVMEGIPNEIIAAIVGSDGDMGGLAKVFLDLITRYNSSLLKA